MTLLRLIFRRGVSTLTSPVRIAAGLVVLVAITSSYRLGGAHEYRIGFQAGRAACVSAIRAQNGETTTRQLKDRLNAENDARTRPDDSDGLRCGPATRDCPE